MEVIMATKKKTVAAEEVKEVKETKAAAKKTTAAKTAKKTAAADNTKETAEKAVKKTAAKKTAEKKTAEKKTAEKKAPARKAPAKKAAKKAEEKPAVAKKDVQEYKDVINWKKWEAHNMNWLYIEVNAGDLMNELEAGADNIETAADAVLAMMLEGDHFIVEPENRKSADLTVRYYCDNLNSDRRSYWDVQ